MITLSDIQSAVTTAAAATGRPRGSIGVEYRETEEDETPWIVRIAFTMAASRKGYGSSVEGYGASPQQAAADAVGSYRRAVDSGFARA